MKHFLYTIVFFLGFTLSAHAQLETHPTPIWEGIVKSEADIENDHRLVKRSLELTNGDRQKAVEFAVRLAWERIGRNDPNGAIRRFNQAWLIDPEFPDIFWGFAIATHIRGDDLEKVERWFLKTEEAVPPNARLFTDHGRVLEERKMPEKARKLFERAIAVDPNYPPAHVGMMQIAQAIGDTELFEKHQSIHDGLTN